MFYPELIQQALKLKPPITHHDHQFGTMTMILGFL